MEFVQTRIGITILSGMLISGCSSLFFGNIRPIEERSTQYTILDLSLPVLQLNKRTLSSEWTRLESLSDSKATRREAQSADQAFQSMKSAAIISVNSACKRYETTTTPVTLQQLTQELLLGISNVLPISETTLTVSGVQALETASTGKMNQENIIVTTVVFESGTCVFDLMYITKPMHYKKHLQTFHQFVSSLRLKL